MSYRLTDFLRQERTEIAQTFNRIKRLEKLLCDGIDKRHRDLEPIDLKTWWSQQQQQSKQADRQQQQQQVSLRSDDDDDRNHNFIDDNVPETDFMQLFKEPSGATTIRRRSAPPSHQKDRCQEERQQRYRSDLLRQIEEKRRMKAKQTEQQANQDRALEEKIAQQRLAIYLEYLNDKQKHENGNIGGGDQSPSIQSSNQRRKYNTGSSHDCRLNMMPNDYQACGGNGDFSKNKDKSNGGETCTRKNNASASDFHAADNNLLVDLNEVRRIMQTDHYELLEKLIVGDWNMASVATGVE